MPYYSVKDLPATEMLPGISRRSVYLDDVMITFVTLEPHAVLPEHDHPHQQITYVVSGTLDFVLDGEKRTLRAGDGALAPPNVAHSAVAGEEGCYVLDAWHPVRDDYR